MGAKSGFDLHGVLANICRPVMETVSVLPFAKFRENRKNIWRKYGENMSNILVLTSFFAAVLNQKVSLECNIFLTCTSYAFQICPGFICPIFWDTSLFMISACIP